MTAAIVNDFDSFIAKFNFEEITERLSTTRSRRNSTDLLKLVKVYSSEARVTLPVIEPYLGKNKRILEVGAGLCLLSLFLRSQDYNIIALEPAQGGFDHFNDLKNSILESSQNMDLAVLDITAQELDPAENGHFDLIFSNNVLEHIPDINEAFLALANVLAPDGQMIHTCPNYVVPYEPHFGLPVVKFWPRITSLVWPEEINGQLDLWESLNFLSYFQLRKIATRYKLKIRFSKHVMYNAFLRIGHDSEFAKRHSSSTAGRIYRALVKLRLLNLIKVIPPALSTPMIFEISHKKDRELLRK
ncbi:Methyltransferase domain family protein [gamma proteobacterium NOR5-3]|nr:Methyltransferase domain family protein [gamma proteobacterium NOR5-3]